MNPYSTLGIPSTADGEAIRDAYRAKAKLYHPDVSTFPDAQERFIRITQAYDLLCDPMKRARYDRFMKVRNGSAGTEQTRHRHEQDMRRTRAQAERQAATFSRMRYEQFDKEFFSATVGYFVPKMLGCFGIIILACILFLLCGVIIIELDLPRSLFAIPLFSLIPLGTWLSTRFDAWHERSRRRR